MAQLLLIGLGAGAAAALLFASLSSGIPSALLLAQLAPLPILIAGLGWSYWTAMIAVLVAGTAVAAYFGALFAFVFLLSVGLPAWWLSYLALLARPGTGAPTLEWYPAGRIVIWACLLGGVVTTAAVLKVGVAMTGFEAALRTVFERFLRLQAGLAADAPLNIPGISNVDTLLDMLVLIIPPAAAATAAATNLMNVWIAGRVVQFSGRLKRPWPDLADLRFPPLLAAAFAAVLVGSALPDLAGVICRLFAACLVVAYALAGLSVLHALTRARKNRFFILATTYTVVAIFQWPAIVLVLLGVSDGLADWRTRMSARARPPAPPPSIH
jgi:hypothetical protein